MKSKYKLITFMIATIICLIVVYLHLLSHEKTQKIYLEQTEKVIIELKKVFLQDTVNNILLEIDRLRESKYNTYKRNTESKLKRFQDEIDLSEEEFKKFFIDKFKDDLNTCMWTVFLWNNETGEILYDPLNIYTGTIDSTINNIQPLLFTFAVIEKDNLKGVFGISKSYIDEIVKEEMGNVIRNRKFSNDSYIWVNEVINFEGGKNYAIRRVHPNLRNTEGTYLSTDMEDAKGNLPYLQELEGIKKDGELFFSYYFKRLNSSQISEKISYAKLYKDYNWIVTMGIHLDDIVAYTEKVNEEINSLSSEFVLRLLGYILLALLIGFIILSIVEKNYLLDSTELLEKEINIDTLTKASSRRYGETNLTHFFKRYELTGEKPAIMILDIDNFKHINDKYGHKVGDIVLTEIVNEIKYIIRSSDLLIRWGGDEFIGIFPGLREEHIIEFGEKILDIISSLNIPVEDGTISTTISIGFSYFKDTDNDYNDVLKRADDAMYLSKGQGKNRVNILI